MTQQEISIYAQLEVLREKSELMRKIYTPSGFYEYYFSQLKCHKTQIECFNYCNDLHFELFGSYKYSSYKSFQNVNYNKHSKKKIVYSRYVQLNMF